MAEAASGEFQGLRTVIYHAPDLAKARAWYSEALGIEPYFDQPFTSASMWGATSLDLIPMRRARRAAKREW